MFVTEPPLDAPVSASYAASAAEAGHVMNYVHAWAWRQDVTDAFGDARSLLSGTTSLSPREIAVINTAVAGSRDDAACAKPRWMEVVGDFNVRGGIKSVIAAHHGTRPK